jgi:cytochrome c-type biogenesis protein CcmH
MRYVLLSLVVVALLVPGAALAAEDRPTLAELEGEVMCPVCNTTLALSNSPAADQIRRIIRRDISAGKTEPEIKSELVAQFGEGILAAPPTRGFNLLAWLLPLVGGLGAAVVLGYAALRWRGGREPATPGGPTSNGRVVAPDRELERRLDEELARFDT